MTAHTSEGSDWKPGLPKDYTVSAQVEVDDNWYEVQIGVTREFLTDAVTPGRHIVDALDRAAAKARMVRVVKEVDIVGTDQHGNPAFVVREAEWHDGA